MSKCTFPSEGLFRGGKTVVSFQLGICLNEVMLTLGCAGGIAMTFLISRTGSGMMMRRRFRESIVLCCSLFLCCIILHSGDIPG